MLIINETIIVKCQTCLLTHIHFLFTCTSLNSIGSKCDNNQEQESKRIDKNRNHL